MDKAAQSVKWLRGLAVKGGKGTVDNIDARSLGRIADEIDSLCDWVEELERDAEEVSAEFERDLWVVVRQLFNECNFDWGGGPVTADTAHQHIHETLNDLERMTEQSKAAHAGAKPVSD